MKHYRIIILIVAAFIPILKVSSQNIEEMLSKYTEANGQKYMQPLADALGSCMNSGLSHTASVKKMGFQLYLGIAASAAFIPDKNLTFTGTTEGVFSPKSTAKVPTIFGPVESVKVNGAGGTVYAFPPGLNVKYLPFAVPQINIGSVYETQLTFRFYAQGINDDIGNLDLFGFGIKHNLNQYIKEIPIDLAVGYYHQRFKLGSYLDAKTNVINLQASKKVMIFTFYGSLGYENASVDLAYKSEANNLDISYNLKGANNIRLTAGLVFNMGPVKLHADYNLASQSSVCVGLGIGIFEN